MRTTYRQLFWAAYALCALLMLGCAKSPSTSVAGDPGDGGDGGGGGGDTGVLNQTGAWMWANPTPQGSPLTRVRYASPDVAYAISAGGAVLKSSDTGASWEVAYSAFASQELAWGYLYGLHFLDAARGWVVGTDGQIARTKDGGMTWTDQSIETSRDVKDVWFLDDMTGFVVGERGFLQRTDDGGTSWTPVATTAGDRDLTAIAFVSGTMGWIGGEDGYVLYTEDAGDTWDVLATNWSHDVTVASPAAPDQVIFGTAQGPAIRSVSPGSWQNILYFDVINDVQFTDTTNGWVLYVDDDESYLGTMVAGTWTYQHLTFPLSPLSLAHDGNHAVLVGWWGMIQYSANDGATWDSATEWVDNTDPFATQLWDVGFAGEMVGLAVGTAGTILRTTDGGVTWDVASSGVSPDLHTVWITEGGTAVAAGDSATVIHSSDGGVTWSPSELPPSVDVERIRGVAMWDDLRGVAVGYGEAGHDGTILLTEDGGATWTLDGRTPDSAGFSVFLDVWTEGTSLAWIAAKEGRIVRTDDGGDTWTTVDGGSSRYVESVQFVDELHGWGSTDGRDILRTTDGGLTWDAVVGPLNTLDMLSFGSPDIGLAVGPTGSVFGTTDGGLTWTEQYSGLTTWAHARAVWMTSATDGVVVGTYTNIMYTRSGGWQP